MSEDTAHTQHFEPRPVTPINGEATGPQVQQAQVGTPALTMEQLLDTQGKRVEELGIRVHSLLLSAIETYDQFITESWGFFRLIAQTEQERASGNRPTNSTTTQTSA